MLTKSDKILIRSLKEKSERRLHQMYVAEGSRLVVDLLEYAGESLILLVCTPAWISACGTKLANFQDKIKICTESELKQVATLKTASEVLAVFCFPQWVNEAPRAWEKTVFLDGVNDPGNLGSIVRTCDWFAIDQIFGSPDSADLFNNKTVQATMSSLSKVRLHYMSFTELVSRFPNRPVIASCLDGAASSPGEMPAEGILCVGNEARGVSNEVLARASHRVMIPGKPTRGAQSLNVAVATGILLSHWK